MRAKMVFGISPGRADADAVHRAEAGKDVEPAGRAGRGRTFAGRIPFQRKGLTRRVGSEPFA